MVLWRAKTLALDLRDGRVAERDKLGYLLVALVIQAIIGRASLLGALRSLGAALGILVVLAISVVGTIAAFRANRRGDGRQFLERYLCLAVPLGIQMYVGYAAVAVPIYLVTGWNTPAAGNNTVASGTAWSLLYYGALVWFYFTLRLRIAVAAGATVESPPA
jgi:hypothetical protein